MMRKIISFLLILMLLAGVIPPAAAAKVIDEGNIGDNITYQFYDDGRLVISGTGDMMACSSCTPFFYGKAVRKVVIQPGITSLGEYVFKQCTMEEVSIPETVTSIKNGAFYSCDSLTSVRIPDSVTSIGFQAFLSCSALKRVDIPAGITYIGSAAFGNCEKLEAINVAAGNANYTSEDGVLFNKSRTELKCFPPADSSKTAYTVPDGVRWIEDHAFSYSVHLKEITIPDSVTDIGSYAFCMSEGLEIISLSAGVARIGEGAFNGCDSLRAIQVASGNTVFASADGVLTDAAGTRIIRYPEGKTDEVYTIPDGITTIQAYAFMSGKMKKAIIPDSVTQIERSAFSSCSALDHLVIPDSVTSLETYTFSWCSSLTEVTLPKGLKAVGYSAFNQCKALARVYYKGSKTARAKMEVDDGNEYLLNAKWQYKAKGPQVFVTSIKLNRTKATLKKGKTLQLKIKKMLPADATNKKVKWTSSNKKVATVDKNGKIKAKGRGTCTITCTAADGSGVKVKCKISVK